jgi:hypothetical protein
VLTRLIRDRDAQPVQAEVMVTPARYGRLRYELARVPTQQEYTALRLPGELPVPRTFRVAYRDRQVACRGRLRQRLVAGLAAVTVLSAVTACGSGDGPLTNVTLGGQANFGISFGITAPGQSGPARTRSRSGRESRQPHVSSGPAADSVGKARRRGGLG